MVGYYKRNADGTIQSRNKQVDDTWLSLTDLEIKEDGSYATYYNTNGSIDTFKEKELSDTTNISIYKTYYQEIFNTKLEELDYDGIDTVTFWASKAGSQYNVEANSLSNWYEAIIFKNYEILNAVKAGTRTQPTKEEYLAELPQYSDFV